MKILKFISITILLALTFVNCNSDKKWNPDDISVYGNTRDSTYIWCGAVPVEEKYSYRLGRWEFKNSKGALIAAGEYDVFVNQIRDKGACEYEYIENSIDLKKWQFWDLSGDKIEPSDNHIDFVNFKVKNNDSINDYLTLGDK